ncbi:hypothetical protein COCMIDRAFT_94005 [Bipolaris oryzae ATCC 44560]|uniref:Uncharacterized protein n=1 Tax=Bipolaris oryzae ATCC 44560 TaxID=930090 RepID=W6Z8A8_COCMI|nr:uncharacterized protein COCMIDRAFT_94005 [Bipolaris oryzae ATCC 44560]EUC46023.1 hypothetical protein COCMIDRAFT_94005 [Bipolaris oryzae ATCC 44560]
MVYSWDDKEAVCYRLYVEERKSLEEVIAYWEVRGFTPSKRAFQTQFKRWDFPSKQNPAHKNPALVARLQQLWEQNCTQKEMMDNLQAEGFDISDRELLRLRLRLKLLLRERVSKPKKAPATGGRIQKKAKKKTAKVIPGKGLINQLGNAILAEESLSEEESGEEEQVGDGSAEQSEEARPIIPEPDTVGLSPEDVLRRQLRQQQLQAESDEKWRTRKRRRRTRGWAGLPADAPGEPPRFPSETTIDEAKAYLCLDNNMYRELRERFLDICKAEDVVKKTIAGPEKWAQIVQQLIKENTHLTEVFQQEPEVLQNHDALFRPKGQRALSLDVICMDVTKRLRTLNTRMSLADAKNILGLNPEQTRRVRSAFAEKLRTAHFTNKLEAGEAQWTELKQTWVNESEHLVKALSQGENDPDYARKLRALEVLARDVTKRQQQENAAKDPNKKRQVHQGPGPGPAPPVVAPHPTTLSTKERPHTNITRDEPPQPSYPTAPSDLQIDPSLLLAASDASVLPTADYPSQSRYQPGQYQPASHYQHTYYPASTTNTSTTPCSFTPLPIYFRLHPHSSTPFPTKSLWLSILHSPSISELHNLATREHPGTEVRKLEGLIAYKGSGEGREVGVQITDDEELGAYLGVVRGGGEGGEGAEGGGKAVFGVLLLEGVGGGVYV